MLGPHGGQGAVIRGDSGYITAQAGTKVAHISRWNIRRSGTIPGTDRPILRFRAQFDYVNETLMNLKLHGQPLRKRVIVEMKREGHPKESIDILGWDEWRYEGGILTLENVLYTESSHVTTHAVTR